MRQYSNNEQENQLFRLGIQQHPVFLEDASATGVLEALTVTAALVELAVLELELDRMEVEEDTAFAATCYEYWHKHTTNIYNDVMYLCQILYNTM